MTSFLQDVVADLHKKGHNLSDLTFVLPSKRAGTFLKKEISTCIKQPILSPTIYSIESFVEELSQIKPINNTELLFEFYNSYLFLSSKEEVESFDSFSKWAQIVLQDFNEIDRHLINSKKLFNYLGAIKTIESGHWTQNEKSTDIIKRYLNFWGKLEDYYSHLSNALLKRKRGYQGLIYREAIENLESYIQNTPSNHHVFLGFNALNASEEIIIQELLKVEKASIYWDIDQHFLDSPNHNASVFIKKHFSSWEYLQNHSINWAANNYSAPKNISVFGVPKQVGQVKFIGQLLQQQTSFNKTAVVLNDEALLTPMLNALPKNVDALNITMGLPLKELPISTLFNSLLELYRSTKSNFYYKDVIKILSNDLIRPLLTTDNVDFASKIIDTISKQNLIYLNIGTIKEMVSQSIDVLDLLFFKVDKDIDQLLENFIELIHCIKKHLNKNKSENALLLEYLFRFYTLFNNLKALNDKYGYIKDINSLYIIYKELISNETLDFKGEPLQGLQLMGMLETRVLDFETVIIASVNEGILPAGKTNRSFIPFDVKLEYGLPTFKEKDAVYTYHFFRLLQRAKNVYILYNTESDSLYGGEKSRFIKQLELEDIHHIEHKIVAPQVPSISKSDFIIEKSSAILSKLKELANKGFSPSALTNYIRNPLDFYYQKILKINEYDDAEETIAANTLGTVIHNSLEEFYKPFIGKVLTIKTIESFKDKLHETVILQFKKEYKLGDIKKGKNLIIFEIAKQYILNFLNQEINTIKQGNTIKILAIEAESKIELNIPELNFPIFLTGKVDRVDEFNGTLRVIDYKTGKVDNNQVEITDWELITTDYKKYSKPFQLLCYMLLLEKHKWFNYPLEAGIVSFKNLNKGVLKFTQKTEDVGKGKTTAIDHSTIENFKRQLHKLIIEICNQDVPFIEKQV